MTRPARLVLVAASGLARETAEAVRAAGNAEIVGVLDDDPARWGQDVGGMRVLGPVEAAAEHDEASFVLCAGAGRSRALLEHRLHELGLGADCFATVVHPGASLGSTTLVGAGSIVLAGAVMTADVAVGRHCVLMPNAVLTHDDELADFVTVCAGVALAGYVAVGAGSYLGAGCLVRERIQIGAWSTIGRGAVVVDDVPADEVWVGNPARWLRQGPGAFELPAFSPHMQGARLR